MAIKRALVVDDSRSARAALKKLLEEHQLEVAEAPSGEIALEFLQRESVDVIFMDHTMPGMDGLEAVTAIKANPATATIPVMMYTTREGEVYVGQARALGAVGVMPKNVQPHQLFEMLLHLGLVQERRNEPLEDEEAESDVMLDADDALEQQALGISVQALVARILEDQHLTLRSDILRSQKAFARDVAREILREQALNPQETDEEFETVVAPAPSRNFGWLSVLVVIAVVAGFLAWQFKNERDTAYAQLVATESARADTSQTQIARLQDALGGVEQQSQTRMASALAGFAYAAKQGSEASMYEEAFDGALADRIADLLPYIEDLGFGGRMTLISHLGRFCLVIDDLGNYQLAPDDLPMLECDYIGHVLEDNTYISDRLDVEFSRFLNRREGARPEIELVALDAATSQTVLAYPGASATAGEWNEVARQNNRVEVSFSQP